MPRSCAGPSRTAAAWRSAPRATPSSWPSPARWGRSGPRSPPSGGWPLTTGRPGSPVRVRMGLHTGEGVLGGDNYVGLDVNRAARIAAAGHGGQVLVSDATRGLVAHALPEGVSFGDLGPHRLKDLALPEHLYDLVVEGLRADFPPPRTLDARRDNLPRQLTSFVGREEEIAEVKALLDRARLVTLSGPGGVGKTRLAVAVAERVGGRFAAGIVFVPLAAVTRPELALGGIARAVGVDLAGTRAPLEALAEQLGDGRWLLVLDNLEQVIDVAGDLDELLARCPGVAILATSRTVLGLGAEQGYPVAALSLPADPTGVPLEELMALAGGGAVRRPGPRGPPRLRPHPGQCVGGGGAVPAAGGAAAGDRAGRRPHPAAGPRGDPGSAGRVAGRVGDRGGGPARAPAHPAGHRRLERGAAGGGRAVAAGGRGDLRGRLDPPGRRAGRWAGGGPGAGAVGGAGPPQPHLPGPHRARLAAADAGDRPGVRGRAAWRPGPTSPRSSAATPSTTGRWPSRPTGRCGASATASGWSGWRPRRATWPPRWAGTWPTTRSRCPTCSGCCGCSGRLRDHLGEARAWVDQLLPAADALDPRARAELAWTALVTADEVGDDQAVLAARERLATAAGGDRGPLPAGGVRAGHGLDRADRRRPRRLPCGGRWPPWSSSVARTSRSGRRWPSAPPAWWRRPWAATTTPGGTCARRAT